VLEQTWARVEPTYQFWQDDQDESGSSSSESESESEEEEEEDEEKEEEEEFADGALLVPNLPRAIQIQRLSKLFFKSPLLRPCQPAEVVVAVPLLNTVRARSLSTGSW
jgi:TATA-binding protein-associated factor Taf7